MQQPDWDEEPLGPAELRHVTVVALRVRTMSDEPNESLSELFERLTRVFEGAGALVVSDERQLQPSFAIFGARQVMPHGADAALTAAREAQRIALRLSVPAEASVRFGIDTGKALLQFRESSQELSVSGAPLATAAALAAIASEDYILVDETTRRLVADRFSLQRIEPPIVDAPSTRMPCFRLQRTTRPSLRGPSSRRITGSLRPMLGREDEVAAVRALLEEAVDNRTLLRCAVQGAPGSGRTRFAREVAQRLQGSHAGLLTAEATIGRPSAPTVLFGVLGRIVRSLLGTNSGPQRAAARLQHLLEGLESDGALTFDEAALRHLGGLGALGRSAEGAEQDLGQDPELASEVGYRAVLALLRHITTRAPLLLLVEEMDEAPPRELALLARLTADLVDRPVILVTTGRPNREGPGAQPSRPAPPASGLLGEPELRLSLGPLSDDACRLLIDQRLNRDDALDADSVAELIAHAGGNALLLELTLDTLMAAELLVSDATTGVSRLPGGVPEGLPSDLPGLMAARLDQVPESALGTLRKAAVAGDIFWRGLITALGEPAAGLELDRLEAAGIIERDYTHNLAGHVGYRMSHAIVREVAHGDLADAERKELHGQIARWLAFNSGERFHEWLGAIAWHFHQSGDATRAVSYHLQAGRWARGFGDVGEAAHQFDQARGFGGDPDLTMQATFELGEAHRLAGADDEARTELLQVRRFAELRNDERLTLRCDGLLARIANDLGESKQALALAGEALARDGAVFARQEMAHLHLERARALASLGDEALAIPNLDRAARLCAEVDDPLGALRVAAERGAVLIHLGRFDESRTAYEAASTEATRLHHWFFAERARHGLGWVALSKGEWDEAGAILARSRAVFARLGMTRLQVSATLGQALTRLAHKDYTTAANLASEALRLAEAKRHPTMAALAHAVIGHTYGRVELGGGRIKARDLSESALAAARTPRAAHLAEATKVLHEDAPVPRLYRLLSTLFQAVYLLGREPRDPAGLRALATVEELAHGYAPSTYTEIIQELREAAGGSRVAGPAEAPGPAEVPELAEPDEATAPS